MCVCVLFRSPQVDDLLSVQQPEVLTSVSAVLTSNSGQDDLSGSQNQFTGPVVAALLVLMLPSHWPSCLVDHSQLSEPVQNLLFLLEPSGCLSL